MKIKVVTEDLKILKSEKKKEKNDRKIVKIYRGLSLVLLWAGWGQFIFGQFLGPADISQDLQAPSYVVGSNYRVLIYCTCHFQGGSLGFSFLCLLVSSVSDFCPDTRRMGWWALFLFFFLQAHLFSRTVGREGCCKELTLACARSVSATLGLPPLTACAPSLPTQLRLQVASPVTIQGRPWAACTSQVQASQVQSLRQSSEAQTPLGLCFVPFPGPSSSADEVFGECGHCNLLPLLSLLLGFLGVQLVHLLRQMMTVQNPKKTQLAKKPACSQVDNVSLGLRFPPSGSGCLSLEGDDLQPAGSVQPFVLCEGLVVSQGFLLGSYPTV